MSSLRRIALGVLLLGVAMVIFLLALLAALGDAATVSQATVCEPPSGWVAVAVPGGRSLSELADELGVSIEEVLDANCLSAPPARLPNRLFLPENGTSS